MWQKYFNITDHLGSVRSVVKASNGAIVGEYDYKPFGEKMPITVNKDRLSFINKEKDFESSLGDFGVRKYEDGLGRFTTCDPLFEKYYGWSPYVYSANNPVSYLDNNGKYYWLANFNINKGWLNYPGSTTHVTSFLNLGHPNSNLKSSLLQDRFNNYINAWNDKNSGHYAPNVAKHAIDKSIPVGLANMKEDEFFYCGGEHNPISGIIALNNKDNPAITQEGILLHETVHDMGYGEFGAWCAILAAGYITDQQLYNYLTDGKGTDMYIIDNDEEQDKWFAAPDIAKYVKRMRAIGKQIIGAKKQ